jgi:hypothetical protein
VGEVRGYADSQLRNPDDPTDVTNRRISIIVLYKTVKAVTQEFSLPDSSKVVGKDSSEQKQTRGEIESLSVAFFM